MVNDVLRGYGDDGLPRVFYTLVLPGKARPGLRGPYNPFGGFESISAEYAAL